MQIGNAPTRLGSRALPPPAPLQIEPNPAPDLCQQAKDENAVLWQQNATLRAENEALKQQVPKVSEERETLARKIEAASRH